MGTLDRIRDLENGWFSGGGVKVDEAIIEKLDSMLSSLPREPLIVPLANGKLQFEYECESGRYLEYEVIDLDRISVFMLDLNEDAHIKEINFTLDDITKVYHDWYSDI